MEQASREKTGWKLLKPTGTGLIEFKPVSGLSHHASAAPRIGVLESRLNRDSVNSVTSIQHSASSTSGKAESKALLEKNKSGNNLPLNKILGIE